MDFIAQHPWRELLLKPLSPEAIREPLADDHPQWEFIDGEMVKLGSLAHSQLDIPDIQNRAMNILSQESKDCRLLAHLLRTLQHSGKPVEILIAIALLADYADHFWPISWPNNSVHKRRLTQQILKRFGGVSSSFTEQASSTEREEAVAQFSRLLKTWQESEPTLVKEIEDLLVSYQRQPSRVDDVQNAPSSSVSTSGSYASTTTTTPSAIPSAIPLESVEVDSSNDRAWRHTLLKVSELLCERQPEMAIGYRLRRYAIWNGITSAPQAQPDGRTPLAAVSADRVTDYLASLPNANIALWRQIEQSVTVAPYWLDGHHLSAQVAVRLNYPEVADAIRDELSQLLNRVPTLKTLYFTDRTPFLSPETAIWLEQASKDSGTSTNVNALNQEQDNDDIWQCYQEQGLEAALHALEQRQQQQHEPRDRFYSQLLSAQLLESAGFNSLAHQGYLSLLLSGQSLSLTDWEPSLFNLLAEKIPSQKK